MPNPSVSNLLYKSIKKGRGRQWQRIRLPVQETKETWVQSLGWEDPREPDCISSVLPGKSHGQRSLVGCSPWGCKESGMTERLRMRACRKAGIFPPGQSANTGANLKVPEAPALPGPLCQPESASYARTS